MSPNRPQVELRPLPLESQSVQTAAVILSDAFSGDSLLRFLYNDPDRTWNEKTQTLQKWQEHRVWEAALNGIVLEARTSDSEPETLGLCMLHPPRQRREWTSLRWLWLYFKYIMLSKAWLPQEPFCNQERVVSLYSCHGEYFEKHTAKYPKGTVWYLSVVAVLPTAQGLGVGGRLIRSLLSEVGNAPCFLECTEGKNVDLYRRFGFELVEKVALEDKDNPDHHMFLHYMIREGKEQQDSN